MMNSSEDCKLAFIVVLALMVSWFLCGFSVASSLARNQAVQTECARYSPDTGEFEWINKEVE